MNLFGRVRSFVYRFLYQYGQFLVVAGAALARGRLARFGFGFDFARGRFGRFRPADFWFVHDNFPSIKAQAHPVLHDLSMLRA
jgi:hypothetical protein